MTKACDTIGMEERGSFRAAHRKKMPGGILTNAEESGKGSTWARMRGQNWGTWPLMR
jgi:hypothetical protein